MTLIRVLDIECTGLEPPAEVIEIGAVDVAIQSHTKEFEGIEPFKAQLVRNHKPIPPEASAIHHIVDIDTKNAELWDDVWPQYLTPNVGIYVAHNSSYEEKWLTEKMRQGAPFLCTYKAALRVWPDAPNHKNQTLRYWLQQQPDSGFPLIDRELLDKAHRAGPDALATACILACLLKRASLQDMLTWTKEPALLPTCPIGEEWRGKPWPHVEYSFLTWILKKIPDQDIVWNAKHELERRAIAQEAKKQTTVPDSDVAIRRKAYVTMAKSALAVAATVDDLEKWFRDERSEHFHLYGITPSTEEFTEIVIACKQHKEQLLKQKTEQSVLRAQLETERAAA